jgi:hypothetical protein
LLVIKTILTETATIVPIISAAIQSGNEPNCLVIFIIIVEKCVNYDKKYQ